ncbi:MAG: cysteine--tRNA ligase [Natronohydrobacter sp.]|nr:cysteine--tRNA ligase [Natronohydrobacter sp.]
MTEIRLHNSRTRRKEPFAPIDAENVRMYVCGPTVYDRAHLGNARPVVVFDVLYRLLRHVYGEAHVTYVRNFTDVDDKINARARAMQEAGDARSLNDIIRALTDETIDWYHADMDALGALRPDHEPRATEFIVQMVAMIEGLIAKGHAYAAEGHVLFDVRSYPDYGKLSGRSVDDMIAGARVEVAPYKRDPMDFVLWKPSSAEEPGWDSPWGRGRPGWHIECSAMSHELLGPAFDIHGGGIDLQFPHHENEIAQSCCAHPEADFANFWLHNEMVQVEGKKMSKSLGNFFTVRDLLDQGWPGEVIRFVMLSTHYRKPMDWTEEKAREASEKLRSYARVLLTSHLSFTESNFALYRKHEAYKPDSSVVAALSDDLNSHLAITHVDALVKRAKAGDTLATNSLLGSLMLLGFFEDLASIARFGGPEATLMDEYPFEELASRLSLLRKGAMQNKDFTAVDDLKRALLEAGVEVRMSKTDVSLSPGPNFDPAKLEELK